MRLMNQDETVNLLKSGEVAALFRVDPKTVARWAAKGLLPSTVTPGGQRRYRETDVRALLAREFVAREWTAP